MKKNKKAYIIHWKYKSLKIQISVRKGEIKMVAKDKNIWILIVFLLSGLVIGGLVGELASKIDALWWLSYGESFGLTEPLTLDLSVVNITFGIVFKLNISSIIGMILAMFIYRKV